MYKVAPSYENATIVKVDEETGKALISQVCGRCGGSGAYVIPGIFSGTCFACEGNGKISKWVKAYTEKEYDRYILSRDKAKERKRQKEEERIQALKDNSEANKAELLTKWGYDAENPQVYIIVGKNTYDIKEEIKTRGGRYNPVLGWYFSKETEVPEGYSLVPIDFNSIYEWMPMVKRFEMKEDEAKAAVEEAKCSILPPSKSEDLGDIKERLRNLHVTLTGARAVDSVYGTSIMFTFKEGDNELVWFTSSPPDEKDAIVGHEYSLTGTVKDHRLYNGVKQTYLNRCILKNL